MKFTKSDFKTLMIVIVAVILALIIIYAGEKYDVPGLTHAHEGAGG